MVSRSATTDADLSREMIGFAADGLKAHGESRTGRVNGETRSERPAQRNAPLATRAAHVPTVSMVNVPNALPNVGEGRPPILARSNRFAFVRR